MCAPHLCCTTLPGVCMVSVLHSALRDLAIVEGGESKTPMDVVVSLREDTLIAALETRLIMDKTHERSTGGLNQLRLCIGVS